MKIASSSLEMSSSHVATQMQETQESLRIWDNRTPNSNESAQNLVQISDAGLNAQQIDAAEAQKEAIENDPKMVLLRSLIEFLTGKKINLIDLSDLQNGNSTEASSAQANNVQPSSAQTPQAAGYGIEYNYHAVYRETEQTDFAASGVVKTTDGKAIKFDLQLGMQRSYSEETDVRFRQGDAAVRKQDPLVINFSGTAAQLTNTRFKFDLDNDGSKENINFVNSGSGFLVFDRNHDGKANNGSELFGPASGNGFQELAALDSDQNGWIDENDAAYQDLRVWIKDEKGQDSLLSLKQANVGAIALASVSTAFDLKDAANQLQGQIRSTGVYLQEDGQVRTIQQVDLTV